MEEDKAGAESSRGHLTRFRTGSIKPKRSWKFSNKDFVVPAYKRRKVARKNASNYHVDKSRCLVEDGNEQIKCCYVVLERLTEDPTTPNSIQQHKLDIVNISREQSDVQHQNQGNLESSHVEDNGNDTDQTDGDGSYLTQHEDMFEDELTNTYQVDGVVLYSDEHLTKQCEVAVSKMRDILKRGPTHQADVYSRGSGQTRQCKGTKDTHSTTQTCASLLEEGQLSDVEFHVDKIGQRDSSANPIDQVRGIQNDNSVTIGRQFSAKKIRQYEVHSKKKSQCQSDTDSDTSAGTKIIRQENIVAGQQNLSEPAIHRAKQRSNTKLTSKAKKDKWTFSKRQIEEQERMQCDIDTIQIDEWVFDELTPDETDEQALEQKIEVGESSESDTHRAERLSAQAASKERGGKEGVGRPPVSTVKAADEAELVYRFWPEDAQEVYRKEKAMSYLSDIRTAYRHSPQIYNKFVDLVRSLKVTTKPAKDIRQEVCNLFEDNPHLVKGFNMFLPADTTQETLDGTGVNEGYLTKYRNKLVTNPVNQPTVEDTLGSGTDSTIHSIAETSPNLLKDTSAHPKAGTMVKNTSKIVNSPWMYPKKRRSQHNRNTPSRAKKVPMKSILNIPNIYQQSKSKMTASGIYIGSGNPTVYTVIAVPPVPVDQSHSLCDIGSVACADSRSMDSSVLDSDPLSTNLTSHPTIDTMPLDGTYPVIEGAKSFVLKSANQHEPTTQILAETVTDNTIYLTAETVIQQSSHDDINQETETHSQTEILLGSEAKAGTEREWGTEGESQNINQPGIEAVSQPTKESVKEKQLVIGEQSQSETHRATTQPENLIGTEAMSQTENHSRMKAMSYLTDVKTAYMHSPQIYNKFVDLVRSLKETSKSTKEIRQEIRELFEDNPHLITGFNVFLPADTTHEIPRETGVTKGCPTKSQNKLVTHHVNQPTVKESLGPETDSTIHSPGESSAHLVKDTSGHPKAGTMVKNTSKIVNSPWMNPNKSHSKKMSAIDIEIRKILNIPIVYPESMTNASEISTGRPENLGSIHPTGYMATPPVTVEQSHSLCDVDVVACAASRTMDSSVLDSDSVSTNLASHPAVDTISVDGTYTVKEGTKPFVLKFPNQGADPQETKLLRDLYTSSFPQFPQVTIEGISQPSGQLTSQPATSDELPIGEPTTQTLDEAGTDTTNQLSAATLIQSSSPDDKEQGTEAPSQTEIRKTGETESGTEIGWETDSEAQNEKMEAASCLFFFSQTVKVSAMEGASHTENHKGPEPESQTRNHLGVESEEQMENYLGLKATAQTKTMLGTESTSQTVNQMVTEVESQSESYQGPEADLQTESHQGIEAGFQAESHRGAEAKSQAESCLGPEVESQTESHQGTEVETENHLGMKAAGQSENQVGNEVESETESHQEVETETYTESHHVAEAESQAESCLGMEADTQTEYQVGTEGESETESHLAMEVESQIEKMFGTEVELQTESHLKTEAESQTKSCQGAEAELLTESRQGAEAESQTESRQGAEAESQTESHQGAEAESQTESRQGSEAESQTESRQGAEAELLTESRQGAEAESQTESRQGVEAESQTESRQGSEAESQTESRQALEAESQTETVLGTEVESQTESHQKAMAESQTESHPGVEAEAQTEKLLGSDATSQTENQLVVEVESQTENKQGIDAAFQTENQARTETERQAEGDQQTLLSSVEPSVSNMESQNVDPVYVDEGKALSYILETTDLVTRQMVRQMETEAKSTQVLTGERSVNKVTLLGRVGRPAEMRGTANYPVTVFPLATSISIKRDDGTYEQQTEWHRISIFRKGLRDIAAASITTGDRVYVSGSIKYGSFEQDGRTVYSTSIVADDVIRLTAKSGAQSSETSGME